MEHRCSENHDIQEWNLGTLGWMEVGPILQAWWRWEPWECLLPGKGSQPFCPSTTLWHRILWMNGVGPVSWQPESCIPAALRAVVQVGRLESLQAQAFISVLLPAIPPWQSRLFLAYTSKLFWPLPLTKFQSCFYSFRYLLQQHPASLYQSLGCHNNIP